MSIAAFVSARLNDTCTLDQAAKLLGLKRSRLGRVVRQLLAVGLARVRPEWHIKRDEVEAIDDAHRTPGDCRADRRRRNHARRRDAIPTSSDSTLIALVDAGQKGYRWKPVGRCDWQGGSSGWVFKRASIAAVRVALMPYRQSESDCRYRNSLSIYASSRRSSTPSVALGRLTVHPSRSPRIQGRNRELDGDREVSERLRCRARAGRRGSLVAASSHRCSRSRGPGAHVRSQYRMPTGVLSPGHRAGGANGKDFGVAADGLAVGTPRRVRQLQQQVTEATETARQPLQVHDCEKQTAGTDR